jgi:hypothetical protein
MVSLNNRMYTSQNGFNVVDITGFSFGQHSGTTQSTHLESKAGSHVVFASETIISSDIHLDNLEVSSKLKIYYPPPNESDSVTDSNQDEGQGRSSRGNSGLRLALYVDCDKYHGSVGLDGSL